MKNKQQHPSSRNLTPTACGSNTTSTTRWCSLWMGKLSRCFPPSPPFCPLIPPFLSSLLTPSPTGPFLPQPWPLQSGHHRHVPRACCTTLRQCGHPAQVGQQPVWQRARRADPVFGVYVCIPPVLSFSLSSLFSSENWKDWHPTSPQQ